MFNILTPIKTHKLHDVKAWGERIVVWGAAAFVGLIIVGFTRMTDYGIHLFMSAQQSHWWSPLLLTPLGGMSIVWLTRNWFQGSEGSGIPQIIAALETPQSLDISKFLSIKIAIAKMLLGTMTLAAGFSSGREGPSAQVAASIMHAFRKWLPEKKASIYPHHLIVAGGAAGIAAAFNTPLAGVIFAIEELSRRFEQKTNGVIVSAIIFCGLVSVSIDGNSTYFGRITISDVGGTALSTSILCGIICGAAGGLFSRILGSATKPWGGRLGYFRQHKPVVWAGACGLIVALLGLLTHGDAHGSGYITTRNLLDGAGHIYWYYAPLKYIATLASYLSGAPGGIFAPSLAIGAGIGYNLLPILSHTILPAAIYALCMAAFLAAVTQAPLTSMIIVMEMIDGHRMVIGLMAASLIACLISRLFGAPLYSVLATAQLEKIGIKTEEIQH